MLRLPLVERLVIAVDFEPDDIAKNGLAWANDQVLWAMDQFANLGVYLKFNSILRALGYSLIEEGHSRGLRIFGDLKLNDIPNTLAADAALLAQFKLDILTVMCTAGSAGGAAVKKYLPDTEVLGVTVLTSLGGEGKTIYNREIPDAVDVLAEIGVKGGMDGVVCSGVEAEAVRRIIGDERSINCPAIRPLWSFVANDDQDPARILTPIAAARKGVDRGIIGRPIMGAKSPREAATRTLEEMATVYV